MTPKNATNFYRIRYTKKSDDPRYNVLCEADDPDVLKAVFELQTGGYNYDVDFDFDFDARDELGKRVQHYRIEEIQDLLGKMFEAGVAEGTRRVRETLREVIGLDLGRR